MRRILLSFFLLCFCYYEAMAREGIGPVHGLAMHGDLQYPDPKLFTHFPSYNRYAKRGGVVRLPVVGRVFDTLNPFLVNGMPAIGLGMYHYLPFDSLMERSPEEPFSLYGRLAETVEVADDRSWIIFHLRKEARFNDANKTPVLAQDVVFTFHVLRDYGSPARKLMAEKIKNIEILGPHSVKFVFHEVEKGGHYDRELPLVMGLMPVLSEKSLQGVAFDRTGLVPLIGSGPYKVASVEPGKSITYERVWDYWGNHLPVNQGVYNFDKITYVYFGNELTAFEAFKCGLVDYWCETDFSRWAQGYMFSAVKEKKIIQASIPKNRPMGMTGLVFNTRLMIFEDIRVRKALTWLLDFEWLNQTLFHGACARTHSFFQGTELQAQGLPSEEEKNLLAALPDVSADILGPLPLLPKTDGSGNLRYEVHQAHKLLQEAGWVFQNRSWVHPSTGQTLSFEILITNPKWERVLGSFVRGLKKAGIQARVKMVDGAVYVTRLRDYKFDMILHTYGHSLSPGCEQKLYWLSDFASKPSRNYPGVRSKAIDQLTDHIAGASTRENLVTAVRVLDRLLRHGYYMIPLFHRSQETLAYWGKLSSPPLNPDQIPKIYSWWIDDSR